MSDIHTPDQRHRNMAAIRSTSTKPELTLRHAMWRKGYRYTVNDKRLPGKPDIVLSKYHSVIFIHGCFWHGHKGCQYFTVPKTNTDFWATKIARNQERDQDAWRQLEAKGWNVIIVWECELKKSKFPDTLQRVIQELQKNLDSFLSFKNDRKNNRLAYLQERRRKKDLAKTMLGNQKNH